jgi:hypothetical protein
LALIESAELNAYGAYINRREQQWLVQFLMTFNNDFERLRGLILHCSQFPSIDSVVSELLTEEIHLWSYSKKRILFTSNPFMLVVSFKSFSINKNKLYIRFAFDECNFCK